MKRATYRALVGCVEAGSHESSEKTKAAVKDNPCRVNYMSRGGHGKCGKMAMRDKISWARVRRRTLRRGSGVYNYRANVASICTEH